MQNREEKKTKKFSKFLNNKMDYVLVITVLILVSLGVVMVLSASAPSALSKTGSSYTYFIKQFGFAVFGIIAMLFVSKIDYRFYKKYFWGVYVVSVLVLLLVLVPHLGKEVNGALRWIEIKGLGQFQPSEITKIGLIIFYAGYLSDHKSELKDFWRGFFKPLIFLAIPVAILYRIQNHLSVSFVISVITFVMMLMAGVRVLHFVWAGLAGGAGLTLLLLKGKIDQIKGVSGTSDSFRLDRIKVFFDPWSDETGTGYQIICYWFRVTIWRRTRKQQTIIFIQTRTTKRLYLCNNSRRTRICRVHSNNCFICCICLERNSNSDESTRHVWKLNCCGNNHASCDTSNYQYSSCNSINPNNWNGSSIL